MHGPEIKLCQGKPGVPELGKQMHKYIKYSRLRKLHNTGERWADSSIFHSPPFGQVIWLPSICETEMKTLICNLFNLAGHGAHSCNPITYKVEVPGFFCALRRIPHTVILFQHATVCTILKCWHFSYRPTLINNPFAVFDISKAYSHCFEFLYSAFRVRSKQVCRFHVVRKFHLEESLYTLSSFLLVFLEKLV